MILNPTFYGTDYNLYLTKFMKLGESYKRKGDHFTFHMEGTWTVFLSKLLERPPGMVCKYDHGPSRNFTVFG